MDGGIVSSKVGMTKPDQRMFSCFLERFGLKPENCLFVDDTEENVLAARALGFSGFVFSGVDGLMEELQKLGVETAEEGV